jgi:hypothetical protein
MKMRSLNKRDGCSYDACHAAEIANLPRYALRQSANG